MEIGVDTLSLITLSFFLRAELTNTPSIYTFSNQLQVKIVCGSEVVSVTGSPLSIILGAVSSINTRSLISHFSSSMSLCYIVGYQAFARYNLATVFRNPSISLDTATALLSIDQSTPQKVDLFVQASTLTAQNFLEVKIVVCGNE
jgi:hypothetical protein